MVDKERRFDLVLGGQGLLSARFAVLARVVASIISVLLLFGCIISPPHSRSFSLTTPSVSFFCFSFVGFVLASRAVVVEVLAISVTHHSYPATSQISSARPAELAF